MRADYTVYVDEAGDLGINRGTQWFVLTAVIVKKSDEPVIRKQIAQVREKLNICEIHFRKVTDFFKRAYIVRELSGLPFAFINILVDTAKFDSERIPSPLIAYNYMCKYLLQRVSMYLGNRSGVADIILSARGTARDGELIEYIKQKLLPFPFNEIPSERFNKITAMAAASRDLLQLADMCATSMFLSNEINGLGFSAPCFMEMLSGHLFRQNGILYGYGVKFFQRCMMPDRELLNQTKVCAKKERIPGATAT